ncbi:hypothetical protein D9M72_321330 [compost metagenome]
MINNQIYRNQRIYLVWIFPFARYFCPKRSNIYNRGNACKILHQHAGRLKRNVFIRSFGLPIEQGFYVFARYREVIKIT